MLLAMEHADGRPINLGSGTGVSIRQLVDAICAAFPQPPNVVWDSSKRAATQSELWI